MLQRHDESGTAREEGGRFEKIEIEKGMRVNLRCCIEPVK